MKSFWKGKRVIITGAAGFIGSNAVDFFIKKGAKVIALVHPATTKNKLNINLSTNLKKVDLQRVDLLNLEATSKAFEKGDYIFHFAAIDGNLQFKNEHSAEIFSKNMRINLNVLEAIKENKQKLLFVSTSDFYDVKDRGLISEKSKIGISWEHEIDGYKLAKWTSELAVREFVRQYKLQIAIVRPSNLYGPRDEFENKDRMRFIPSAIIKIIKENKPIELWGDGKQVRTYLYVYDFMEIISEIMRKGFYNEPVNISSQQKISLGNLANKLVSISKSKIKTILLPDKPSGAKKRVFDASLLKRVVQNIEETSIEDGLKETVKFYKDNYL